MKREKIERKLDDAARRLGSARLDETMCEADN